MRNHSFRRRNVSESAQIRALRKVERTLTKMMNEGFYPRTQYINKDLPSGSRLAEQESSEIDGFISWFSDKIQSALTTEDGWLNIRTEGFMGKDKSEWVYLLDKKSSRHVVDELTSIYAKNHSLHDFECAAMKADEVLKEMV